MISNKQFLEGIFGSSYERSHVTSFIESPDAIPIGLNGRCWAGRPFNNIGLSPMANNFYVISTFKPIEIDGYIHYVRQEKQLEDTYAIVLDDYGTRLIGDLSSFGLPQPTYVLETSPGNQHVGYRIHPCHDAYKVKAIQQHLIKSKLCVEGKDPGMSGVTRYVRLPVGTNTKKAYLDTNGDGFETKLISWNPERIYHVSELIAMLGIAEDLIEDIRLADLIRHDYENNKVATPDTHLLLRSLVEKNLYVRDRKNGWHQIVCPRHAEHTNGDRSGSYVVISEDNTWNFKCHHSHGGEYDATAVFNDLTQAGCNLKHPFYAHSDMEHLSEDDIDLSGAVTWVPSSNTITPRTKWLLDGVVPAGCGMLSGPPGKGKTTFAISLFMYVAGFGNYLGSSSPFIKVSRRVYIISENVEQIQRAIAAYRKEYGIPIEETDDMIQLGYCDKKNPKDVLASIRKLIKLDNAPKENAPLIVIDTVPSIFDFRSADGKSGGENDNDAVSSAISTIKTELWEKDYVSTLMLTHPPKGGTGARGAGSFEGNTHFTMDIQSLQGQAGEFIKIVQMVKRRVQGKARYLKLLPKEVEIETVDEFDGEIENENVLTLQLELLSEEQYLDLQSSLGAQQALDKIRERDRVKVDIERAKIAVALNAFGTKLKQSSKLVIHFGGRTPVRDFVNGDDLDGVEIIALEEFFKASADNKLTRDQVKDLKELVISRFGGVRYDLTAPKESTYAMLFETSSNVPNLPESF